MRVLYIALILTFNTMLCIVKIPKMIQEKLYREVYVFCFLVFLGTLLAILKSLDSYIPNPSDWIAWVYSPVADIFKSILK